MAFAISTIIGAVGVAVGGAGLLMNYTNSQEAAASNSAAAGKQAEIGALQAANVGVQKQQLNLQTNQQQLQIQTQKDVIAQQGVADGLRVQAAELDSKRRTRDAIRQGIVAQSTSLVRATNQGAGPGSSVVAQSAADSTGQTSTNIAGVQQNLDFGRKLFAINKNISSIYLNAQDANSQYVAQSKGLQEQVLGTQQQIYKLGGDASSNYAQAAISQGNAALGQGIASIGATIASNSQTLGRLTNYFSSSSTPTYSGASSTSDPTGYGSVY